MGSIERIKMIKEDNKKGSPASKINHMKKYCLLNPGPVMTSEEVRKNLLLPDICHRELEFSNLLNNISKKLNTVFKANQDFTSLVLTGSGTCAMESIISSCIKNKVLCISNGAFGERWNEIIDIYNIKKNWIKYNWCEIPNIEDIEKELDKDKEIDSILIVHTETSTGMINPVREVGKLANKYKKLFLVDAVSSIGLDEVNVCKDNIDFCAASSHKGLGGIPGLSIICARNQSYEKIKKIQPRNYYCDLRKYYNYKIQKLQTPTTPAIQAFYALNASLEEIIKEGANNKIKRVNNSSKYLRKELINLGFNLLLDKHNSNGITSVIIPKNCSYNIIHDYLKDKGFIIYNGKGPLKEKIFQVSIMGETNKEILHRFLNTLGKMIKELNMF